MKNNIPNAITCLNLLCGALAVIASFSCYDVVAGHLQGYQLAYVLIGLGAVADFCDGLAARALHAVSGIGKELDSLSDLVTFGLAPAMLVYNMLGTLAPDAPWLPWLAMLIAIAGALRLARFNVSTDQATTFTGLPIPANAIFWIGATAWAAGQATVHLALAAGAIVALSWLMISPLRMFSLKLHSLSVADNWAQYLLIAIAVTSVIVIGLPALALTIGAYVVLAVVKVAATGKG